MLIQIFNADGSLSQGLLANYLQKWESSKAPVTALALPEGWVLLRTQPQGLQPDRFWRELFAARLAAEHDANAQLRQDFKETSEASGKLRSRVDELAALRDAAKTEAAEAVAARRLLERDMEAALKHHQAELLRMEKEHSVDVHRVKAEADNDINKLRALQAEVSWNFSSLRTADLALMRAEMYQQKLPQHV